MSNNYLISKDIPDIEVCAMVAEFIYPPGRFDFIRKCSKPKTFSIPKILIGSVARKFQIFVPIKNWGVPNRRVRREL